MGKSNKKVKSDRINAIRKQYDSFLEEDKKRKERNEYILGKLDNMRYSTAIVPLHHQPLLHTYKKSYNTGSQPVRSMMRECIPTSHSKQIQVLPSPNIPDNKVEEALLIQEISKRFILIPKLTPNTNNNYIDDLTPVRDVQEPVAISILHKSSTIDIPTNVSDNTDWKSKYEILNTLEKEVKAGKTAQFEDKSLHFHDQYHKEVNNTVSDRLENNSESCVGNNKDVPIYADNLSDRDIITYKNNNELHPPETYNNDVERIDTDSYDNEITVNRNEYLPEIAEPSNPGANVDYEMHNTNLESNDFNGEEIHEFKQKTQVVEELENSQEYETGIVATTNDTVALMIANVNEATDLHSSVSLNRQQYEPTEQTKDATNTDAQNLDDNIKIQTMNPTKFGDEINKTLTSGNTEDDIEYPIDVINVQDFTPHEGVELQDGININPDDHVSQQINYDTTHETEAKDVNLTEVGHTIVDESGITEFEKEQEEMFYSEQSAGTHYEGDRENAYDPTEYSQNQQNEEYTYYEGVAPEAQIPVEINEHEETTQPYDQNYEQQYVESYQGYQQQQEYTQQQGYEQQQAYVQQQEYEQLEQQQGYEQSQGYEQQQGLESQDAELYPNQQQMEQLPYEEQNYEGLEQVEQVLDHEQGYVVPKENIAELNTTDATNA